MLLSLVLLLAGAQETTGVVKGQVTLKGDAPAPKKFKAIDEKAQKVYPNGVQVEPVPVDKDKHVKSVLVYVKAGLEGKSFLPPKEPKTLDAENFQFTPRMLGIMAGQELVIANKDDDWHAVHAGALGCAPATLARDYLIRAINFPHDDRLNDAVCLD